MTGLSDFVRRIAAIVSLIFVAICHGHAEGIRTATIGASALGKSGGRSAQIDNSSAVVHNPANLTLLSDPEVSVDPNIIYMKTKYRGNGVSAETESPWSILPNLFAAYPIKDGKYAFGLGVTVPYGLAIDWDENSSAFTSSPWRYTEASLASMETLNVAPTFAMKVGDQFRFGVGLNIMYSELELEQFYPWALITGFPVPDGQVKADGDGTGIGATASVAYDMTDKQTLAFRFKSPMKIDYDGDMRLSNVPAGVPIAGKSDFSTDVNFPMEVGIAYGIRLTDEISVGVDFEWIRFSSFDTLPLGSSAPPPGLPAGVDYKFKNTFTLGIGGDWRFKRGWIARASYHFFESPVSDRYFRPSIPDANQHVITCGLGYETDHHSFDFGYGIDFYEDRNISNNVNPQFNGNYETMVHLFALNYRYRF